MMTPCMMTLFVKASFCINVRCYLNIRFQWFQYRQAVKNFRLILYTFLFKLAFVAMDSPRHSAWRTELCLPRFVFILLFNPLTGTENEQGYWNKTRELKRNIFLLIFGNEKKFLLYLYKKMWWQYISHCQSSQSESTLEIKFSL